MVPLLQRVTFEKRKSNQNASAPPLGASPRLGIHAEVPTAQHLRSAIVVNGASEINVHREAALEPTWFRVIASLLWERA